MSVQIRDKPKTPSHVEDQNKRSRIKKMIKEDLVCCFRVMEKCIQRISKGDPERVPWQKEKRLNPSTKPVG